MHNQFVCPNCGEFVKRLFVATGWCQNCTLKYRDNSHCGMCGTELFASEVAICTKCKRELWLERNASLLDNWIMQGLTFRQAVVVVLERNRPTCLNCGEPIKHGTNGRHLLCTRTPECRRARRRYKYLVYEKGVEKDIALRVALGLVEREAA